jgi:hypothetical protein
VYLLWVVTNYQWYKGTTAIIGATNAVLTLSNIQDINAGTYSVIVTSACNNVTSTNTTLIVNTPTSITVQPVSSAVICNGTSTNLSVTAVGTNFILSTVR